MPAASPTPHLIPRRQCLRGEGWARLPGGPAPPGPGARAAGPATAHGPPPLTSTASSPIQSLGRGQATRGEVGGVHKTRGAGRDPPYSGPGGTAQLRGSRSPVEHCSPRAPGRKPGPQMRSGSYLRSEGTGLGSHSFLGICCQRAASRPSEQAWRTQATRRRVHPTLDDPATEGTKSRANRKLAVQPSGSRGQL